MRNKWKITSLFPAWLKEKLPALASDFSEFLLLDSHHHRDSYSRFEWICAWGCENYIAPQREVLSRLRSFAKNDWCFGHLNYNLKNEFESLNSLHADTFKYPLLTFFIPQTVLYCQNGEVFCESTTLKNDQELEALLPASTKKNNHSRPVFESTLSRQEYLQKIASLKEQLQYGNIYEVNFCMEILAHQQIDPASFFARLNGIHQAPFSAFYRWGDRFLLCFSPERYLRKYGNQLISQPIKGTAPRSTDETIDKKLAEALSNSEKERSENVMIVDLVRNDLSRTARPRSVSVEELCGIYRYEAVHQMVSTVSSKLREDCDFADILRTSFPMGSMTGAPKVSAMQLIDAHENFNRSLYAGSVGYITPVGNFDFNVVIRSLLYHQQKQIISARVGSAITTHCQAEKEYEECLLKAEKLIG